MLQIIYKEFVFNIKKRAIPFLIVKKTAVVRYAENGDLKKNLKDFFKFTE
jgi:hypothetical protein